MTTLVTGATGAVGIALVRALLDRGDELRILVRPESDVDALPDVEIDILDGDITNRDDVMEAVAGCDRIFHLAGLFKDGVEKDSVFFDVNVGGTVNVLQAALEHHIQKLVILSSASTIGEQKGATGTEETEHRGYFLSAYERSKWEAEQFVAEYVAKGVPAVILNPSLVYGPGDNEHNGGRLASLLNGVITASVDAPAAYIFVGDLIKAILAADKAGIPGQRYLVSGTNTTRINFLRTAAAIAGVNPALRVAAPWQLKLFLGIERVRRIFGNRSPVLTQSAVDNALHGAQYDSSKAIKHLGIEFTALEDGLDETIEWLYQEGKIDLPEEVVPDGDEGQGERTMGDDEGDWEWVDVENDEELPDDDDEWEWEEVVEGEDVESQQSESDWEWTEAEDTSSLDQCDNSETGSTNDSDDPDQKENR